MGVNCILYNTKTPLFPTGLAMFFRPTLRKVFVSYNVSVPTLRKAFVSNNVYVAHCEAFLLISLYPNEQHNSTTYNSHMHVRFILVSRSIIPHFCLKWMNFSLTLYHTCFPILRISLFPSRPHKNGTCKHTSPYNICPSTSY